MPEDAAAISVDPDAAAFAKLDGDSLEAKIKSAVQQNS